MNTQPNRKLVLDPTWKQAVSFSDWVIRMRLTNQTHDPAYQAAERFHGKARLDAIWEEYQAKRDAGIVT